tara:strand:- start:173 stop:1555 length:1383 start_codon:yes stop_codon:yes gene_type:complete
MKKIIIFVTFLILILVYSITNHFIGTSKISVKFLSDEQKKIIKKYFFPYKLITLQEKEIQELEDTLKKKDHFFFEMELDFKRSLGDIQLIREDNTKLSNDKNFIKYKLVNGFTSSVYGMRPGGYLDFHKNNLLILSARGILAFTKNIEDSKKFTQIDNNIDAFIGLKQFKKDPVFSLRDIFVHKNKIYVSFIEEIKEDCWNTSVIHGEMDYKNIIFKKLFSSEQCNHSKINDGGFTANSSGGRIVSFDENHILLSVGDYIQRYRAQDKESINGKILKINVGNGIHEIISMGHRNPQGLYFDKKNNIILETEHGPKGGDEINIIETSKLIKNEPFNYGWAVASYGEHYGGNTKKNEEKYKKYPLLKSHKENGFIEPIKYFVPSIGISEITKIGKNKYVTSSMGSKRPGDKSLYFFELNEKKKLVNLQKIKVNQRVRDLKFKDEKLYLFLEETATIGIISLK